MPAAIYRSSAGRALAEWRRAQGLTVPELARRCGVTRAAVEHWTSGRHVPSGMARRVVELVTAGAIPAGSWPNPE